MTDRYLFVSDNIANTQPTRNTERHNKTENRQKYIQTATLERQTDRTEEEEKLLQR